MLTLADLAKLAGEHADEIATPVASFDIGGREFDFDAAPAIMGVVNMSRDSWYRERCAVDRIGNRARPRAGSSGSRPD